jgi:hypothetical protein
MLAPPATASLTGVGSPDGNSAGGKGTTMATETTALAASNSLTDLAARIKVEHAAAAEKLSEALRHAMAAGDLLIEAKGLVKHGQWLPWLKDHVDISERTAQLYMRVAKNRAEIEAQKRNDVADLSLGEAMALLALSSDVRKLLMFAKECEGLEGEELVQACLDAGVGVVVSKNYNRFAGRSDEERREWKLFTLWLIRQGHSADWAAHHVEWVMRSGDGGVAEWLGEEGDLFRARLRMRPMPDALKADWSRWSAERGLMTETEIDAEMAALAHNATPVIASIRKGRRK